MRRLVKIYIVIFVLCVFFTSCSTTDTLNLKNDALASYIKDLSDDSMQGRLVGTEGNKRAANYIVRVYKDLGLSPYTGESFLHIYKHKVLNFDKNSLITILDDNGKQIDFAYGKDYLEASVVPGNFTCPIISDKNNNNISNSFIILESENEIADFTGKAKGILVKSKTLKKYTGNNLEKGTPLIQINEKMFNYIIDNRNLSLTYNCAYTSEEIDANNIIGLIPGSKHGNALILSAHFDHVGIVNNSVYSGAVDNCSGIAVLLDIAKKLQLRVKEAPFDFDIYICAFNGEESNLQGSKSFANYVKKHHSNIVNINLDTLGDKSKEMLILGDTKASHTIVHLISDWFKLNKQNYRTEPDKYRSDHISFQDAEIPAISLIQEKNEIIHSIEDKYEKVDVEFLHYLSDMIYKFIIDINNKVFDTYTKCEHTEEEIVISQAEEIPGNEELENLVQQARSKLKFGEYIVINKYDRIERIYNNSGVFKSMDALLLEYPDITIPYKNKDYALEKITVVDGAFPEISRDIIYDKAYKNELSSSNISFIEFSYNSINEDRKLTFRYESEKNKPMTPIINTRSEAATSEKGEQYTLIYNKDGKLVRITRDVDTASGKYILTISKGRITDIKINNVIQKNVFVSDWNSDVNEKDIKTFINSINANIFPVN